MSESPAVEIREPRTYRADGPESFLADVAKFTIENNREARSRLDAHAREVRYEIEQGSPEGIRAFDDLALSTHPERRAGNTSTIAGFTTPQFLWDQLAVFRGVHRTFVDQTTIIPLPPVGMQFNVPSFTGAAGTAIVTENSLVVETDPTGAGITENIQTVAGDIYISIQLYDRAMSGGGAFDIACAQQLQQNLDQATDLYAINQALSGAGAVAGAATWTDMSTLYDDLSKGREVLTDTAGIRYRPTHLFTTGDLFNWMSSVLDSEKRPVLVPTPIPGKPLANDDDSSRWSGYTGIQVGTMMWFYDDNIPSSQPIAGTTSSALSTGSPITSIAVNALPAAIPAGTITLRSGAHTQNFTTTGATLGATSITVTSATPNFAYPIGSTITVVGPNTQLIVARPDTLLTLEGTPGLRVMPDNNNAGDLQILVQLRNEVVVIPRFPEAVAAITGNAYPTTLK